LFSEMMAFSDATVLANVIADGSVDPATRPLIVPATARTATFEPVAILTAKGPLDGRTIGPLGYTAPDCSGGPALLPGDKVLLFLSKQRQYPVADWRIGVFGDTIVFRGNQAFHLLTSRDTLPAGSSRSVIELALEVSGASPANRQAVLAFLAEVEAQPPLPPPATAVAPTAPAPALPPSADVRPPSVGEAGLK
jgi:hypothetical protein